LPPHLVDKDDNKVAEPASGDAFRPAGEWWYDSISGYCFQANGHGQFEGVATASEMVNCETGERFGPVTNLFRVRERPGHPLQRCREFDSYGMDKFQVLLNDMWTLNQYWASNVIHLARKEGVVVEADNLDDAWDNTRKKLPRSSFDTVSAHDPRDCKLLLVLHFSEEVDKKIRDHYAAQTENPWIATSPEQQKENQQIIDKRRNGRDQEHERIEAKEKAKEEMSKTLVTKYSELKTKAHEGGLPGHLVDELLEAASKERGQKEPELSREILEEIEASIELEIETVKYQAEESPKLVQQSLPISASAQEVNESTTLATSASEKETPAAVACTSPTAEFKKMFDSCEAQGLKSFQLSVWLKTIAAGGELYTQENFDKLNVKIAQHFAARAAAELDGNKFEPEAEIESAGEITVVIEGGDVAIQAATEEAKSPRPSKAAEKAAEKAKKAAEQQDQEIKIEMALKAIEDTPITHRNNGEVKTFNEVTKYWFQLQIKEAALKLEIDTYKKHMEERLSEITAQQNAWMANYGDGVEAAALEQFEKQKRVKLVDGKEDISFSPPTVKTQYCTFKKSKPEPFLSNKLEYAIWLASLEPGEAAFYGDALEIKIEGRVKSIKALVADGTEIPGWSKPIPTDTFRDVVGRLKPSLSIKLGKSEKSTDEISNDEENSGGSLSLVPNDEEDAA